MERKVCTVTGLDSRGLPYSVLVEAGSLFEAAAAGLEQLQKQGCLITEVQILVHEPGKRYTVHPRQLENWLLTPTAARTMSGFMRSKRESAESSTTIR